jgi:voltage-dependent calcium channel L type alpha-1D
MSALMLNSKPLVKKTPPDSRLRLFLFRLAEASWFDFVIIACIICNSLLLALRWYEQTREAINIIEAMNLFFTVVFLLEAIIKIGGYGRRYFKENWNRFDFFIVVVSVAEWVITQFVSL